MNQKTVSTASGTVLALLTLALFGTALYLGIAGSAAGWRGVLAAIGGLLLLGGAGVGVIDPAKIGVFTRIFSVGLLLAGGAYFLHLSHTHGIREHTKACIGTAAAALLAVISGISCQAACRRPAADLQQ
jgi:hypothetical protein